MTGTSRAAALAAGERFYVGRPCPKGHPGLRYAGGGNCVECMKVISRSAEKKVYDRIRVAANRETLREQARVRYLANAERRKAEVREWVLKNPARRRAISKAYKCRRRQQVEGGDSTATIREWEQAQPKVCFWCLVPCADRYHVDHFFPLARGGVHAVWNLVVACPRCNMRKGAKHPLAFAALLGAEKQSGSSDPSA